MGRITANSLIRESRAIVARRNGWTQGSFFTKNPDGNSFAVCLSGALGIAAFDGPEGLIPDEKDAATAIQDFADDITIYATNVGVVDVNKTLETATKAAMRKLRRAITKSGLKIESPVSDPHYNVLEGGSDLDVIIAFNDTRGRKKKDILLVHDIALGLK